MEIIEAFFISNKQHNYHECGHANSKPDNVDARKNLVFPDVTPGDLKVILYHQWFISLMVHLFIGDELLTYYTNIPKTHTKLQQSNNQIIKNNLGVRMYASVTPYVRL